MISKRLLVAAALSTSAITAGAAEIQFNPGQWETTMTRTNPMTGEPITETRTEWIKDDLDGDTLMFQMECGVQGGSAMIDGQFQTDGETGKGNMDMTVNAGGMNMQMNMNWTARRLGDC